jgi:hypothetical protein
VFGTFFLLYAPVRDILLDRYEKPEWLPIASAICAIPATMIGVPSDVLKKRIILSSQPVSVRTAIQELFQARGFFAGWQVNLIRDLPFAAVKLSLYEVMVQYYQSSSFGTWSDEWTTETGKKKDDETIPATTNNNSKKISPLGASLCGIASGVICGVVTCPLDVINTEIKAHAGDQRIITGNSVGASTSTSNRPTMLRVGWKIICEQGYRGLFRGVGMRCIIMGVGSSIFWPIQQSVAQSFGSEPLLPPEMKLEVYQVGR